MVSRWWGIAILAGMVWTQATPIQADDARLTNGGMAPVASRMPQPTNPGWAVGGPPATFPQSLPDPSPSAAGSQPESLTRPGQVVTPMYGLVRLPPIGIANPSGTANGTVWPASPQGVSGTYRDDGQHIPGASGVAGGSVQGRLMQSGRPLANCRVVIVPLEGEAKSYHYDANREPLSTSTDTEGIYFFDDVPAGKYKLTWLPIGTNRWIRRIAVKPDVVVHPGQAATINTIGAAQQTIN